MSKEIIGRLVLEASTGLHGYVAKDLAERLASALQQRAELLDALDGMVESYTNPEAGEVDRKLSMLDARKIIESVTQ